jgi:hypothetical protein
MNVFISYRRDDSILAARVLHGELSKRYGDANVFMDLENIGYERGADDDRVRDQDEHGEGDRPAAEVREGGAGGRTQGGASAPAAARHQGNSRRARKTPPTRPP